MNVGIIVYSQTGNTHSVGKRLGKKLEESGHFVKLEKMKLVGEYKQGMKDVKFESLPDIGIYDALVFGAPVEAFSLAGPMNRYLEQIPSLKGKKVACFVTKALPFKWTGGNRAISIMKRTCEKMGGVVLGTGIVIWREKRREERIRGIVERLSGLL